MLGTIIFGTLLCGMLGVFLFGAVWNGIFLLSEARGWRRWIVLPSSFLVATGALAFFGQGISAVGVLNWLPPTFEWPAGHVDGALTMADGGKVVLIKGAERIQVYDANWRFVRGWPAQSALKLRLLPDGKVEALTKGLHGTVFDLRGNLIARRTYEVREMVKLQNSLAPCPRVFIPTSPWLYILSSPFLSGTLLNAGLLGWFVVAYKSNSPSTPRRGA